MARGKKKETLTPEERLQAALVPESEQPYKVPGNWCWCFLGNIAFIRRGASPRPIKTYVTEDEAGVNWIKIGDTSGGKYITHVNEKITEEGAKKSVFVEEGTLLLSNSMSFGHPYILKVKGCIHDGWLALTPSEVINKEYLYYALLTSEWYFEQVAVGTAVRNLNSERVAGTPTPLPPLPEQQRIVDRIESLFAKLDEAKQKAQDALNSFETRKAAILHKAFTGELTAQWRKEHGVGMESWGRLQWGSFIISIEAGKNWIAEGRPPQSDEFGVVKVSAVTWGEFNEAESKTCTVEEQWNENVQIHQGDFLFSRANTLQLVGNCVIVKSISRRLMLSDKILRFKFDKRVIPDYVLHFTRSNLYRDQIEQLASGNQDGMRNVSQKNMKLVEFPIPKLEEQKEIVRILGDLLAKEEQAKEAAERVLEQIDLIKKAILARAFRGELGTNDPSEESAEALLSSKI